MREISRLFIYYYRRYRAGNGTAPVPASATITDLVGNPLASLTYTGGEFYTIDKTYHFYLPLVVG